MSLQALMHDERLQLLKFVCSFAWADFEVSASERAAVARLLGRLDFGDSEKQQADAWLRLPPRAEEIDPCDVPREHRLLFLDEVRRVVVSDGQLVENERELLCLFERLIS